MSGRAGVQGGSRRGGGAPENEPGKYGESNIVAAAQQVTRGSLTTGVVTPQPQGPTSALETAIRTHTCQIWSVHLAGIPYQRHSLTIRHAPQDISLVPRLPPVQ